MISRRYRFVWISNEKVGSRSLIAALFGVDPDAEWTTNTSIADIHAMYPETRNYFSFAFIRNPFDRAISFHSHLHHFRNVPFLHGGMEHRRHYFSRYHGPAETRHFDAYCEWLNSPYGSDQYAARIFRSQHLVIRMGRDRLPDFVGRLENFRADLDHVASQVGSPEPALPMLNTMAGWRTTPEALRAARSKAAVQLTDRNRALLRKRYEGDFMLGGYS